MAAFFVPTSHDLDEVVIAIDLVPLAVTAPAALPEQEWVARGAYKPPDVILPSPAVVAEAPATLAAGPGSSCRWR